jgi:amino acid transporter
MTLWLLTTFPTVVLGLLIVLVPTALMLLALVAVRRRVPWERLAENNEQGGVLFSVVGTIYAIFLAFLVVVAWDSLGDAEQSVVEEGATVLSLHRDFGALPEPARSRLRDAVEVYARSVVNDEWAAMARGAESDVAHERLDELWSLFLALEPVTPKEQAVYAEAFTRLNELAKQRAVRVLTSEAAIPTVFWLLLVFGGVATVGFTFFLGMRSVAVQVTLTGVMTAMICSALFLIVVLDHPFAGDVRAEPTAFLRALEEMREGR